MNKNDLINNLQEILKRKYFGLPNIGMIKGNKFSFLSFSKNFFGIPVWVKGDFNEMESHIDVNIKINPNPVYYFILFINLILIVSLVALPNVEINGKEADVIQRIGFLFIWVLVWGIILRVFFISPIYVSAINLENDLQLEKKLI